MHLSRVPATTKHREQPTANNRQPILGALWLTKLDQHQVQTDKAAANVAANAVHRVPAPAAGAKAAQADGNSSVARKCASSAPRGLNRSTTKMCACWRSSLPRAARLSRA